MRPALAQLDYVLQVKPTNPSAVVTRSYILLEAKQPDQAAAILRKAIELTAKDRKEKPPAVFYLMLAAVENETPPASRRAAAGPDGPRRGPGDPPAGVELVQAKYVALVAAGDAQRAPSRSSRPRPRRTPRGPFRRVLVENLPRAEALRPGRAAALASCTRSSRTSRTWRRRWSRSCRSRRPRPPRGTRPTASAQLNDRAASMIREFRTPLSQRPCPSSRPSATWSRAAAISRGPSRSPARSTSWPRTRPSALAPAVRLFTHRWASPTRWPSAYTEALERNPAAARRPHPARPDPSSSWASRRGASPGRAGARRREEPARCDPAPGARPGRVGRDAQREGGPSARRPSPGSQRPSRPTRTSTRPITRWPRST